MSGVGLVTVPSGGLAAVQPTYRRRLPRASQKYKFLLKEITINYWDIDFYNKIIDLLIDLLNSVDIYTLQCLPNEGAVDVLAEKLKEGDYEKL